MKKILVMMVVVVMCVAVLTGCDSNTGNTDNIGGFDAVSIESTESEGLITSEETSVEESENPDETVMFSADQVMAEQRFANRIPLEMIMLNENDKAYASEFDEYMVAASELDGDMEYKAKNYADYTPVSSGEKVVVSFSKFIFDIDREYNPYNDYINANS